MTKFTFRLASVLRLREMQLAAEEEKLARLLNDLALQERALASMATERQEAVTYVQNQTGIGNADLRALSAFLLGSNIRAGNLRETIQRVQAAITEQRQRVVAAQRNERLLVKLKESKLSAWQAENDRELQIVAQESWTSVQNVLRRARSASNTT